MKRALFFTISMLLVTGFLFGQDTKEKMRSIVDSYINSALGFNWKTTNFSQNPAADRKFNQLQSMCQ